MKSKRLFALTLALALMLVSTGVFAHAQSMEGTPTPSERAETEPTAEPANPAHTDIPPALAPTLKPTAEPESKPTLKPTAEPETKPTLKPTAEPETKPTLKPTAEPETKPTLKPTAQPETKPTLKPTAEPETKPTFKPTAEPETKPTFKPTPEPETKPTLKPTAEPETKPTLKPTAQPEIYVSPYAFVPHDTVLYRDEDCTEKLGELTSDAVMLVIELHSGLYEAYFDTAETAQTDACERAYLLASSLERPSREQSEGYLSSGGAHRVDGKPVFTADVRCAAKPEGEPEKPQPEDKPSLSRINEQDVNMRSAPTQQAERVALLSKGDAVAVTARVVNAEGEAWYAVAYQGQRGFIRADLVSAVGDIPDMPYEGGELVPDERPSEAQGAGQAAERKIAIATAWDTDALQLGSRITLTATLTGYEGLEYACRWQCAAADRDGRIIGEWQDSQADTLSISYTLSEENLLTAWRLCVTVAQ